MNEPMRTVAMLNRKGGVGKTSLTHHLSGALSKMGRRVLLIDNDPQASLSQGFWGPDATRAIHPDQTVATLYAGGCPFPELLIRPTGVLGVDLVPGSKAADDYDVPRPQEATVFDRTCLRRFLADVSGRYDFALVDCPPNLHLCTWAALAASDHMVVPVQPEDYSAQGIPEVLDAAELVRHVDNPFLSLLGFVLNRCSFRKSIHRLYEEGARGQYGNLVFETRIPEAVAYVEAISRRTPVEQYQHRSPAAAAMRALAAEFIRRAESAKPSMPQREAV